MGALASVSSAVGASHGFNAGDTNRLSVLSFNMQHRENPSQLGVMAERLESEFAESPDFILCQEVLFGRSARKGEENTAAVLANNLGCHWQATKRTSDREGVAIISRYPFVHYEERHLKSQTSRLLLGFRRVSVMGEFMVPSVGRVRVVNVHFTNWGFEKHVRTKQLRETLEWMAQRDSQVPADITILGGDFNIEPDGDELRLVTEGAFARRFNFHNFNTTDPTRGGQGNPNVRLDYIFISSPKQDVEYVRKEDQRLWTEGLVARPGGRRFWLSDHLPVLHEYELNRTHFAGTQAGRRSDPRAVVQ